MKFSTHLLVITLLLIFCTSLTSQIDSREWREDIDFLANSIAEKHVDFFHEQSEAEFKTKVNAVKKSLASNRVYGRIVFDLMELVASAGDGHTLLVPDVSKLHYYPINIRWFDDGMFVIATDSDSRDLLGAKVVRFGDLLPDELATKLRKHISHENEFSFRSRFMSAVNTAEFLHFSGATPHLRKIQISYEKGGQIKKTWLSAVSQSNARNIQWKFAATKPVIYEQKKRLPFWNDFFRDQKTLYFKYNACRDAQGFQRLTNGTAGFVAQNKTERFVLDVRNNSGGNSEIYKPLLKYLTNHPKLNRKGKLFVITGYDTFSSGVWNALEMKQKTNAILVGQPTGGKPNGFGEIRSFSLPNSGLKVFYSTKKWTLLKDSNPDSLYPDIKVNWLSKDYFSGKDASLEAIYSYSN